MPVVCLFGLKRISRALYATKTTESRIDLADATVVAPIRKLNHVYDMTQLTVESDNVSWSAIQQNSVAVMSQSLHIFRDNYGKRPLVEYI